MKKKIENQILNNNIKIENAIETTDFIKNIQNVENRKIE